MMTGIWILICIGSFFLGSLCGLFVAALCVAAKDADRHIQNDGGDTE